MDLQQLNNQQILNQSFFRRHLSEFFKTQFDDFFNGTNREFDICELFDNDTLEVRKDVLDKFINFGRYYSLEDEFGNLAFQKTLLIFLHQSFYVYPTPQNWEEEFIAKTPQEKIIIINNIILQTWIKFHSLIIERYLNI